MTAFFRSACATTAMFSVAVFVGLAQPAVALDAPKPTLSKSTNVVAVKDTRSKHRRSHYRKRHHRGDVVRAPFTRVESGRRHTTVDAPFAHVHEGRHGKRIVAPFVDLWIPN